MCSGHLRIMKQEAHQLVGQAKRHVTQLEHLWQTICVSLMVILRQTVAELFDTLSTGPVLRTFLQYSVTFCSRLETDYWRLWGSPLPIGLWNLIWWSSVKPFLRNPTKGHRRRHFRWVLCDNCRLEVASGVISGVAVDHFCMNARVKFGESRLNRSWVTGAVHFVMDGRTNETNLNQMYRRKRHNSGVSLEMIPLLMLNLT